MLLPINIIINKQPMPKELEEWTVDKYKQQQENYTGDVFMDK